MSYSSGKITEVEIKSSDLISFSQLCTENVNRNPEEIIKLIYLRRYYEILDDKGLEYEMLSSLLKKRDVAQVKIVTGFRDMTATELTTSTTSIQKHINNFDYSRIVTRMKDNPALTALYKTSNNYEKLQIFRVIHTDNHDNLVIKKFINESYHIENEHITQLNPHKYEIVPNFIIDECNNFLSL